MLVLGLGSNVLATDAGFNGVVIRTAQGLTGLNAEPGGIIRCGAGVPLSRLCTFALENSLTGLEFAYGIPGTAGGGAYMNCGAYGGELADVLTACSHIGTDYLPGELTGKKLNMSYRRSAYCDNGCIITELTLQLEPGDKAAVRARKDERTHKRRQKQPLEYPSAGSTFKRPQGYYAGALIEECGLKGAQIGGACVSKKHAGFIVNTGGATSADILALIKHVQKTVFEAKGVMLEPEIKIIEG